MSETALARVEKVCADLARSGEPVTFTAVAERADIGRATLYRNPRCEPSSTNTAHDKPTPEP
jgi:hypothetical protein